MTKLDDIFPDVFKCNLELEPPRSSSDNIQALFDRAQVVIRGPRVPYSQEVEWEKFDPDPKNKSLINSLTGKIQEGDA